MGEDSPVKAKRRKRGLIDEKSRDVTVAKGVGAGKPAAIAEALVRREENGVAVKVSTLQVGAPADVRDRMTALFHAEVVRRGRCTQPMPYRYEENGRTVSGYQECGAILESTDEWLAHRGFHLIEDSKDPRTAAGMWKEVVALLHPTEANQLGAALPDDEKARVLRGLRRKARAPSADD